MVLELIWKGFVYLATENRAVFEGFHFDQNLLLEVPALIKNGFGTHLESSVQFCAQKAMVFEWFLEVPALIKNGSGAHLERLCLISSRKS